MNDKAIDTLDRNRWHKSISWLGQHSAVLNYSIRQNLQVACETRLSEKKIMEVLTQVSLNQPEILQRLDTPLTEFGQNLSGGQQQRLALAKAILKKGALWLLDEPLAHVDQSLATQLIKTIKSCGQNKIMIVVSHRNDWQKIADFCLSLEFPDQCHLLALNSDQVKAREIAS